MHVGNQQTEVAAAWGHVEYKINLTESNSSSEKVQLCFLLAGILKKQIILIRSTLSKWWPVAHKKNATKNNQTDKAQTLKQNNNQPHRNLKTPQAPVTDWISRLANRITELFGLENPAPNLYHGAEVVENNSYHHWTASFPHQGQSAMDSGHSSTLEQTRWCHVG